VLATSFRCFCLCLPRLVHGFRALQFGKALAHELFDEDIPLVASECGRNSKKTRLKMDGSLLARFSALYEIKFSGFDGLQTFRSASAHSRLLNSIMELSLPCRTPR
jgi:hypothetical protein